MATKSLQGMQVAILVTNGFEQAGLEGARLWAKLGRQLW
jgi:hypothetical protein